MMALLKVIKEAGLGAVEAGKPVAVVFGTVIRTAPLLVNVEQRLQLPEELLIIPESLTEYKLVIAGEEYVIRKGLKAGDQVLMMRMQGGQRYALLDRVSL